MKQRALELIRKHYPEVSATEPVIVHSDMDVVRELHDTTVLTDVTTEYSVENPLWVSENASVVETSDGVLHLLRWGMEVIEVIATCKQGEPV